MKCLLFLIFLICPALTCKIAFRLDDVQDYWTVNSQIAIIDMFLKAEIPLSLGVISNYFGSDPTLVKYLTSIRERKATGLNYFTGNGSSLIEFCSHGVNHERFSNFTLGQQVDLLGESKRKIKGVIGEATDVVSFIPPFNAFNNDTLKAMALNSYTHLSSSIGVDKGFFDNQDPIYRYPIGAATASLNEGEAADLNYVTPAMTLGQMLDQILASGFTVVMLHAQEFHNETTNSPISHRMTNLQGILDYSLDFRCEYRLLQNLHSIRTIWPTRNPNDQTVKVSTVIFQWDGKTVLANSTTVNTTAPVTTQAARARTRTTLAPVTTSVALMLSFNLYLIFLLILTL